ncbi:1,4-dihydroxy-2-naphthoate octaprenyltransferase [Acaryochloris thomasi RCC1774]|uniref:2-carboxy-1,4-naphthoquinone phytyltransferase n=1 Tax=Acaryochloris thomasi RCC1774 TaxID=1764569 RepID=A0A2W1JIN0_9CYAN|nr:2-carboxy-1,4-naphthoquinone phytyltransferase [Acaryochloris thomasi]PZD71385.1 1,4-dihydroxy-2-naphthoate octaprenyltransferase [Acaryochloris thomasi RCC1774]
MQEVAIAPKFKLWMAAIKPPMYTVAVIPISVGTAVAFSETQRFDLGIYLTFLGSAILIIAWLNLSNDVFDADTGIDKNKAHSVVNLTGNQSLVFWISNVFLALGVLGVVAIATQQKDPTLIGIILLCCALGYTYQGPPFRLGYQGLGELICFITFGPLAIAAAYYSQAQTFSTLGLAVGTLIGISTSIILFCSHFHQVKDDLAAGKRSPIVRLGTARGANVLGWATASLYLLTLTWVGLGVFSPWTLLVFASLPFAIQLVRHVQRYHDQPERVSNCKFFAVNLQFVSGVLFAISFTLPGLL